ncbi:MULTISPECIES: hypothetical protein [unclassified Crossiella]|uniref:hypothetical protein n=1 Tax=unclassified Crossiella TaxID=2620835 RepID=UPI001FFF376D|nr:MULTISPECIES: hypothetical protein [unclassified Crossiella]MCK2236467.1 hypothetical protein [Crossiella sp. S99.2]MCK2250134.1 hypothetical protein [Crossiella sp. S99.1]
MRAISIVVTGTLLLGSAGCTFIPVPVPVQPTGLPGPSSTAARTGKFGDAVETPGKVRIEFAKPEPYQLGQTLDEDDRKHARGVLLVATITNNTGKTLTNLYTVSFGSFTENGGKEVVEVRAVTAPDTTISVPDLPPGKLTKVRLAFGLGAKPGLLRLDVRDLAGGAQVYFEGEV